MKKNKNSRKMNDLHSELISNFDKIHTNQKTIREQCYADRKFVFENGAQWAGKEGKIFENKPKLEINKCQLSIIKIYNQFRSNKITVDFVSKYGEESDDLADTCDMLFRATEQNSSTRSAYNNAFLESVSGGIGAWRLTNEYEDEYDEDNEKQVIKIEPIYDADSCVFFDLNSKCPDKSDSEYCYVITPYTRDKAESIWPGVTTFPYDDYGGIEFNWFDGDSIYIAEVYKVEDSKSSVRIYKNVLDDKEEKRISEDRFDNDEDLEEKLVTEGYKFDRERKVKSRKIRKYILSGSKILEDCGYIAGKNIPIVPCFGKRVVLSGTEFVSGHARIIKDSQRLYNMQISALAENSAMSTTEKPIFLQEQVQGHENAWANDNINKYAYQIINPIIDNNGNKQVAGPVDYTRVPNVQPSLAALLQLTDSDIKEMLGSQDVGEIPRANISGKAIELIQGRLDEQTKIYMENFADSIRRTGEIWLSMVQDIYVESGRSLKGVTKDGTSTNIKLMVPKKSTEDGSIYYENDLSKASFDLVSTVGPSSDTKRQALLRSVTEMLQYAKDPETTKVLTSFALMNMEGEGIKDIRSFYRRQMVNMGVIKPTEDELIQLNEQLQQQQQLTPEETYMYAAAEKEKAIAEKQSAETLKTLAQTEETNAKTGKLIAETTETYNDLGLEDENNKLNQVNTNENLT